MKQISLLFWGYFLTISAFSQSIVYVTPAGAGTKSGTSWANALSGVQLPNRVATADSGTQFWIAAGTYKPTTATDRTASFSIVSGISVYGGFAGTETSLEQRTIGANETIFSGDIGDQGLAEDNCQIIIKLINTKHTISINGLTIRDARMNFFDPDVKGLGLNVTVTDSAFTLCVSNCRFLDNSTVSNSGSGSAIGIKAIETSQSYLKIDNCYFSGNKSGKGGAIYIETWSGTINTTIEHCTFSNNRSLSDGGAISTLNFKQPENISLRINGCKFFENTAPFAGGAISLRSNKTLIENSLFTNNSVVDEFTNGLGSGGAILDVISQAIFKNCIFSNNSAGYGGVLSGSGSTNAIDTTSHTFINCSFINNHAGISGGVFFNPGYNFPDNTTNLLNCIVWQNSSPNEPVIGHIDPLNPVIYTGLDRDFSATYSLIQNGYPGTGNLNADPLFVDPANGNFRLQPSSPAINAGSPAITDLFPTDIAGNPRIQGNGVDMGAYEFMGCSMCLPFTISRIR